MPRRIERRSPIPTLAELQTKLDSVRREVRNLTVMGMDPNQTTEQAALIKELERSARAEQRLRKMALDYAKSRKMSAIGTYRTFQISRLMSICSFRSLVPPVVPFNLAVAPFENDPF